MTDELRAEPPANTGAFSRPPAKLLGDWSAHVATTLDRLADTLAPLTDEQWDAPSMCEGWRVRDVVGHVIWRIGNSSSSMLGSAFAAMPRTGFRPNRALDVLAREQAAAPTAELLDRVRAIAGEKLAGHGRGGIVDLTEAVVHAYDITEALDLPLRLSPRSTGAVALARLKSPLAGKGAKLAKRHSLRATDAHWQVGSGAPLEATAGAIIMQLFDRRELPAA